MHGVDDALVAGAPAEVPGQTLADLLVAGFRVVTQQSGDGRHETRCPRLGGAAVVLAEVAPPRLLQAVPLTNHGGESLGDVPYDLLWQLDGEWAEGGVM